MISHFDTQAPSPRQGKAYANRAAAAAARLSVFARVDEVGTGQGTRRGGACDTMKRGAAAQAAVTCNGPVSVEHGEQDRCEGTGVRSGAFPRRRAEARLFGSLRAALPGPAGDGCRRARP